MCCDCCCAGNKLTYFSTLHDFPHPGAHTLNLAAFLFAHTHDTRWAVGGFGLLKGQRQGIFGPSRIYIPHWRIGLDLCPYFSILRILHISHIFFIIFASKSRRTKSVYEIKVWRNEKVCPVCSVRVFFCLFWKHSNLW